MCNETPKEDQRGANEPDWRHPKIQSLIGSEARKSIYLGLIEQILDDPEMETTAADAEYWDAIHDRVQAAVRASKSFEQVQDLCEKLGLSPDQCATCVAQADRLSAMYRRTPWVAHFAREVIGQIKSVDDKPVLSFWIVQNTGWSSGISWFDEPGNPRYASFERAMERAKGSRDALRQPSTKFRVVGVRIIRDESMQMELRSYHPL